VNKVNRLALVLGLVGVVSATSCDNPEGFVEPKKHSEPIVSLRNTTVAGQTQLVYRVNVLSATEMTHPHFEGHWTFADNEKPIDVSVYRGEHYVETAAPGTQDSLLFWSSLQNAVVGQQREATMHLHPEPGQWAIVFYNSGAASSAGRATFSATIDLEFFK
jgi:hypothetical protein